MITTQIKDNVMFSNDDNDCKIVAIMPDRLRTEIDGVLTDVFPEGTQRILISVMIPDDVREGRPLAFQRKIMWASYGFHLPQSKVDELGLTVGAYIDIHAAWITGAREGRFNPQYKRYDSPTIELQGPMTIELLESDEQVVETPAVAKDIQW